MQAVLDLLEQTHTGMVDSAGRIVNQLPALFTPGHNPNRRTDGTSRSV